jgi:hypothetical protein
MAVSHSVGEVSFQSAMQIFYAKEHALRVVMLFPAFSDSSRQFPESADVIRSASNWIHEAEHI